LTYDNWEEDAEGSGNENLLDPSGTYIPDELGRNGRTQWVYANAGQMWYIYWRSYGGAEWVIGYDNGDGIMSDSSYTAEIMSYDQCPWDVDWDVDDDFIIEQGDCSDAEAPEILANGDFSNRAIEGSGEVPVSWTKEGSPLIASDFDQTKMESGIIKRTSGSNPSNLRLRQGFSALEKNTQYTLILGSGNTSKKFKIRFRRSGGLSCKIKWISIDGDSLTGDYTTADVDVAETASFITHTGNTHIAVAIDVGITQASMKLDSVSLKMFWP
jgi:hypothetical protein